MRRLFLIATATLGLTGLLSGCFSDDEDPPPPPTPTIAEIVIDNPDFQTLEDALIAADLVATFQDTAASFTVFAPTNDAFAAVLTELGLTADELFADTELLTAVLTYHVLDGAVPAADVAGLLGLPIEPLAGGFFKIFDDAGDLTIQDGRNRAAKITATDVQASNGVVHVIDTVLLPADKDIVATAIATPDFSTLVAALTAAGLVETLQQPGPFTVFAPTNAAFDALLADLGLTAEELFADTELLTAVLTYHVVDGLTLAAQVPIDAAIPTLQGGSFTVDSSLVITDATGGTSNITATDIFTSNGVIHVIDTVILPL